MPRLRERALALSLSLGTCLGLACAPDLPSSGRIASTRILGFRTDVITPLFPDDPPDAGVRCQALPFEQVRLTPFMVTPTGPLDIAGPDFDPIWIACNLGPAQGLFACLKDALPLDLDTLPECPVPSFADIDPMAMSLAEPPSPCRLGDDGSDDGRQDLVVPFTTNVLLGGALEVTMISQAPGSPDTRACAEALLGKADDLPNDCLYGVTRVSIGPLEKLLSLAQMFGFMLPAELGTAPDPKDIPDGDRNPRITSFRVSRVADDGSLTDLGEQPRGATIQVKTNETLQIDTETPETDLQTYPVAINNGSGDIGSETQTERLDGSWYRTFGTLLSGGSDDPKSYNQWTLEQGADDEDELPPDDRATLYYVLRDSRLGIDWWWLNVEVVP